MTFLLSFITLTGSHPRYVMDYHWHMEYEIVRVLEGILHMTIDGSDFTVRPGELAFITGGSLHAGVPGDCIYQCIVFDLNPFLSQNPRCRAHLQRVADHAVFVQRFFSPGRGGRPLPDSGKCV